MFASTAFGQLRYIEEATAGTTPLTGTGVNLRNTGPTVKAAVQSVVSQEITLNRMVSGSTNTDLTVDGGFNFELSSQEYDPFIAGVLCSSWAHYGTAGIGTAVSITTTANSIDAAVAPSGADAFTNLVKGQWFRLVPGALASTAVKNYFADKWLKVSDTTAPTSTKITLDSTTPLGGAGVIGTAVSSQITTSRLVNAAARKSFTLEWAQTDITQFLQYRGMRPNTLSLNFAVGAILTGSFGFFGQSHDITQVTALPGGPSFTASQDGDVMNSVTDMGVLAVGGTDLLAGGASFISDVTLEISNNLRGQKALGVFGNAGVGYGEFSVTGTMKCYFENETLYKQALNGDRLSLALGVTDGEGGGYLFEMPRIKFKDAAVEFGGKDADVMLNLPFQAFYDASKGYGLSVARAVAP